MARVGDLAEPLFQGGDHAGADRVGAGQLGDHLAEHRVEGGNAFQLAGAADAVAAALLRHVHGEVGAVEELVAVLGVDRIGRPANRCGERGEDGLGVVHKHLGQRVADLLRPDGRCLDVDPGQDGDELLAAVASHRVLTAHGG